MPLPPTTRPDSPSPSDAEFARASEGVKQAVAAMMKRIETVTRRRGEAVFASTIQELLIARLCVEISKMTDDPMLRDYAGPATVALANAAADYRDDWGSR